MGRTKDGSSSANWDKELTHAFCDVAVREIALGNRPTTYFNKEEWNNCVVGFKQKTGFDFDKSQLKNKWDQLKREWKVWKDLKKGATGLGWDATRKTIDAPEEWWAERLQVTPQARKFRFNGIDSEFEEKLDRMFGGIVATGQRAWAPSITTPTPGEEEIGLSDDVDLEVDDVEFGSFSQARATPDVPSKRRRVGKNTVNANRIDHLVTACETIITKSTKSVTSPTSMAKAIISVEKIPEIYSDVRFYHFCVHFLKDKDNRETFLSMDAQRRTGYLRHCYENGLM